MPVTKRSRGWVFTWNNYTLHDLAYLNDLQCKYLIYGKEVGKQGTPHLQGYIHYHTLKSMAQVVKDMKRNHVEIAKWEDNAIKYCKKDGNFFEKGEKPLTAKVKGAKGKEYWDEQLKLIRDGKHEDVDSKLQITLARNIDYIYNKYNAKKKLEDTTEQNIWYWGPTGSGKSRKAREDCGDKQPYLKMCNKWWDHYQDEDIVLIEDFDKVHQVLIHHMKIWADRYPFLAEIKNCTRKIRPRKIIVTSNYHPMEIWDKKNDVDPIIRRFKIIEINTSFS